MDVTTRDLKAAVDRAYRDPTTATDPVDYRQDDRLTRLEQALAGLASFVAGGQTGDVDGGGPFGDYFASVPVDGGTPVLVTGGASNLNGGDPSTVYIDPPLDGGTP